MAKLGHHGARAMGRVSDQIDGRGSVYWGTIRCHRSEELPRDGGTTKIGYSGGAEKKVQHAHKVFDEMYTREKKRLRGEDELVGALGAL
uniref:Uncharacterized protein n=1 Tax=Oryza meridionalis TaxID=40149 RepID=A0A0E0D3V0_9ORYZ